MFKRTKTRATTIKINQGITGETIEKKVRRILNDREPITDGAPLIYTEREEGIKPAYDIRTDKWELAAEAMDKVAGEWKERRSDRKKDKEESQKRADEARKGMQKEEGGQSPVNTNDGK